jgi:hypothetical protein
MRIGFPSLPTGGVGLQGNGLPCFVFDRVLKYYTFVIPRTGGKAVDNPVDGHQIRRKTGPIRKMPKS